MKIQSKGTLRKECGIKPRRISSGKKIKRISTPRKKKVRRLIKNGKREIISPFLKLDKWRTRTRPQEPNKTGAPGEKADTALKKTSRRVRKEVVISKTTKQKQLRKNSRNGLSARARRARVQASQASKENPLRRENDYFHMFEISTSVWN